MELLRTIDGPIIRMSSQLNGVEDHLDNPKRYEILRRISSQPYLEHHEQISKNILAGTGKWLLEDQLYAEWHKEAHRLSFGFTGKPAPEKAHSCLL